MVSKPKIDYFECWLTLYKSVFLIIQKVLPEVFETPSDIYLFLRSDFSFESSLWFIVSDIESMFVSKFLGRVAATLSLNWAAELHLIGVTLLHKVLEKLSSTDPARLRFRLNVPIPHLMT